MSKIWNRLVRRPAFSRRKDFKRASHQRRLRSEKLEGRQLLAANMFHNAQIPEDVNEDGEITALDALTIINQITRQSRGADGGQQQEGRGRMTDVNNDGQNTALDALMVINRMNRDRGGGRGVRPEIPGDPTGPIEGPDDQGGDGGDVSEDPTTQESSDVVLQWNDLFAELLVENEEKQNPGYASRAMAMMNLAIYDSVTLAIGDAADAFYEYDIDLPEDVRVRAEIAASQAAYTVLSSLYSEQQGMIEEVREDVFSEFRSGANTDASIAVGTEIGETILEARSNDGYDTVADYTYSDEIGSFQPDPLNPDVPVWGPAWVEVDPFVISSAEDYAPETTPPISSEQYAESYNEVKELGSVDSATRTADQTEAGIFWAYDRVGLGTPMALFSDVLESISVQEGNSFVENAALYAQASVAMADAGVAAWHTKFSEQFWRPVTAIHQGDADGNDLTEGDEDWTALGAPDGGDDVIGFTPQFPTYVSGHATFGGALFGAIREFYGTDDISFDLASRELEIIMENPELEAAYGLDLDDAVRSFSSLTEAMEENGRSRVYLGIHFDFDDLVGQEVGQAVAETVSSEFVVASRDGGGQPGNPGLPGDGMPRPDDGDGRGDRRDNVPRNRGPEPGPGPGPMGPGMDMVDPLGPMLADLEMAPPPVGEPDLDLLARDQVNRRNVGQRDRDRDRGPSDDMDDGDEDLDVTDPEEISTLV
ncbi:MAG: dockerin type I domain-containing protein [Planctomycetota bacterium]